MTNEFKVSLTEYTPKFFESGELPDSIGEHLWRNYKNQVSVEPPSFMNNNKWKLTSQGWVGYIPLTKEIRLELLPKVELINIFKMLEYAYRIKIHFPEGLIECSSLNKYYELLANLLAKRVLSRGRRGFYSAYRDEVNSLPYVKGRMNTNHLVKKPWDIILRCEYHEITADIEDNQILAWTLYRIAKSSICSDRVQPTVRNAYRDILRVATPEPFSPCDCVGRNYNRLNTDYEALHALCRFFLELTGPGLESGEYTMLPFLVDMAKLFETFAAEWLKVHLPPDLELRTQERIFLSQEDSLYFQIDLVINDLETGETRFVLDTKYKAAETASTDDIAQIIAYAKTKGCKEAILIYPSDLTVPLDFFVDDIRVRTLVFSLKDDLETAGQLFLQQLSVRTAALDGLLY